MRICQENPTPRGLDQVYLFKKTEVSLGRVGLPRMRACVRLLLRDKLNPCEAERYNSVVVRKFVFNARRDPFSEFRVINQAVWLR